MCISVIQYTFIAQLSHIQHECIQINTENKNDLLYNQVSSSMNYRTDDFITRFLAMTLVQIEHHLFPSIPTSSLRQIQHIVRTYCDKNDIPILKNRVFSNYLFVYLLFIQDEKSVSKPCLKMGVFNVQRRILHTYKYLSICK